MPVEHRASGRDGKYRKVEKKKGMGKVGIAGSDINEKLKHNVKTLKREAVCGVDV